jgi:hypothetical protein
LKSGMSEGVLPVLHFSEEWLVIPTAEQNGRGEQKGGKNG